MFKRGPQVMRNFLLLSIAIVFTVSSYCGLAPAQKRQNLTIMTYNVENLFDWTHDEGKKDYAYLPLAFKNSSPEVQAHCRGVNHPRYRDECFNLDWSPEVFSTKAYALGNVIRTAVAGGPDIIVFNEVENMNALTMLIQTQLSDLGYVTIELLEGPDRRGIDVAVVSKFPLAKHSKIHNVQLPGGKNARPTRPILEVHLNINNKDVAIFANHWPSPGNPRENRVAAAKTLYAAFQQAGTPYVIAAGDFNTIKKEVNSGLSQIKNPKLPTYFLDSKDYAPMYTDNEVYGTHWYKGKWDFLDRVLVANTAFKKGNGIQLQYTKIVSPDIAVRPAGHKYDGLKPNRFDPRTGIGVSDHLPFLLGFSL